MGATTLYHPISLLVIRGAAQYCGWNFGKISQIAASIQLGSAAYECTIEDMPAQLDTYGPEIMRKQLQKCFMDDIKVTKLWFTRGGMWKCELYVVLPKGQEIANLPVGVGDVGIE